MDVSIRCVCPAMPHETDRVTLPDRLPFRKALTIRQAIARLWSDDGQPTEDEIQAGIIEAYLLYTVESWSVLDEKGKPLPPSRANVQHVLMDEHIGEGSIVGDAANELYMDKVVLPLLLKASSSSPATPTAPSTSVPSDGSPTPPTPSSPSSIGSITTAVTTKTSKPRAGASSTSARKRSAA